MNTNLPPGVSYSDPAAPWNAPDETPAFQWAVDQVTGSDADLTCEVFGEWIANLDGSREGLIEKSAVLLGPISSTELLRLVLQGKHDAMVLDAVRELRARYVADEYTGSAINRRVAEYFAEAV